MEEIDLNEAVKELKPNEKITISKEKKQSQPPYSIVGNGKVTKDFSEDVVVDTLAIVGKLTPAQLIIFLYFRDEILAKQLLHRSKPELNTEPNEVKIPRSSKDEKAKEIKKLLGENSNSKSLQKLGIIKKIALHHYMINPYMLIPATNFSESAYKWSILP